MGLTRNNLVPSRKIIRTVGGFTLMRQVWLPVEFVVRGKTTRQALYTCKDIQRLYFSRAACIDVGILHENFPSPFADKHKEVRPKPNKCEDQLPNRPPPQILLFPQQKITLANLSAGSWKDLPRRHSTKTGYSQPCQALRPIFTSKRGQSLKPGITQFLCHSTSKNQ